MYTQYVLMPPQQTEENMSRVKNRNCLFLFIETNTIVQMENRVQHIHQIEFEISLYQSNRVIQYKYDPMLPTSFNYSKVSHWIGSDNKIFVE